MAGVSQFRKEGMLSFMRRAAPLVLCATLMPCMTEASSCYPIVPSDLLRPDAPKFEDFKVSEKPVRPVAPDLKSNPVASRFRTVLKRGAAKGPNYAGHYTVVGWGCGSACLSFAVVNAMTGEVMVADGIDNVGGAFLDADDFMPGTASQYWALRYRADSRLLVVLGSLNDSDNEGAFYYVVKGNRLVLVYSVRAAKQHCDNVVD